jgi:small Trp-rich protein
MQNNMIFILLGILLLTMKLGDVHPVGHWEWIYIAFPFILAICWFELIEPLLGLDVRRQRMRRRQMDAKIRNFENKKPQRQGRGFPFK